MRGAEKNYRRTRTAVAVRLYELRHEKFTRNTNRSEPRAHAAAEKQRAEGGNDSACQSNAVARGTRGLDGGKYYSTGSGVWQTIGLLMMQNTFAV
jgi:hypothetical protein